MPYSFTPWSRKKTISVQEHVEQTRRLKLGDTKKAEEALAVESEIFTRLFWNMHNAAVVMESGRDRVTIENWPILIKLRKEFTGIFDQYLLGYKNFQEKTF